MSLSLEQRVEELERKIGELTRGSSRDQNGNWQQTLGLSRDDDGFLEMVRLGEQYRRNLSRQDEGART